MLDQVPVTLDVCAQSMDITLSSSAATTVSHLSQLLTDVGPLSMETNAECRTDAYPKSDFETIPHDRLHSALFWVYNASGVPLCAQTRNSNSDSGEREICRGSWIKILIVYRHLFACI